MTPHNLKGMIETSTVIIAFSLTILAGLSTGIGSAIAFFARTTNTKFLSVSLGFSAGVMIYVSFTEMFMGSFNELLSMYGKAGSWYALAAFFGGIAVTALIDKMIPGYENPHELHKVEAMHNGSRVRDKKKLIRVGMFVAVAISLHNFPEGIATFAAALKDPALGIAIAVAIAIHNIPEGIAVSVPLYYATGSRKTAFIWSFLSGLAEPLGALFAYIVLLQIINSAVIALLFCAVAGLMIFISIDELLPAAREYGEHHLSIYGLIFGMMVMALSLQMFI